MPQKYPTKAILKQFSSIQLYFEIVPFFLKAWSISNFRHREMKKPGRTISPSPTILLAIYYSALRQGKTNLMGRSKFLATVTITSVPQTQKISQKKRAQSSSRPVFVVLRLIPFRATIEKNTPKMLLRAQCRVEKQNPTGTKTMAMHISFPVESQNFFIQRIFCTIFGSLMLRKFFLRDQPKGRSSRSILEMDITIAVEKQTLTSAIKTYLLRYLQRMQIPKRKQLATNGNCLASFMLMTVQFQSSSLLKLTKLLSLSLPSRVERRQPIQTTEQVLSNS